MPTKNSEDEDAKPEEHLATLQKLASKRDSNKGLDTRMR